jgi:hypothetical protein
VRRSRLPRLLLLTSRWFVRLATLVLSAFTGLAFAHAVCGGNYLALALGTAVGFFFGWCAVFDVPEWAGGEPRVWRRGFGTCGR